MLSVPAYLEGLEAYEPGGRGRNGNGVSRSAKEEIYLASNENSWGCSSKVFEAIASCSDVNRYPQGGQAVREKLAETLGLGPGSVVVGNGSDSIIGRVVRTFAASGDEVLTSASTFPSFSLQARAHGLRVRTVPYRSWSIDLPAVAAALRPQTKIVYLPNPNNPTGTMFTDSEFQSFHSVVPASTLVILDQAYYEYASEHPEYGHLPYAGYENVITLRTFSKAYGLAGLRLGYGLANARIIEQLLKTQLLFETNCVAEVAALAALQDHAFLTSTVNSNRRNRARVLEKLRTLGFIAVSSVANFVMIVLTNAEEADLLVWELRNRGILVRPLRSFGLPSCVRMTIGTDKEMETCLREMVAVRDVLRERFGSAESRRRSEDVWRA
jgi:histidinol-phosphate aminotransferase